MINATDGWEDYPGMAPDYLEEGVLGGVGDKMLYSTEPGVRTRVAEIFAHNRKILFPEQQFVKF